MAAAIVTQGITAIRDSLKTLVTFVGVTVDSTAFAVGQTVIDPAGDVSTDRLIKAATNTNVDSATFDATMSITGATEMTNKTIRTISVLNGSIRTAILSRSVRSLGIGVISGDVFTIGVRVLVTDAS